MLKIIAIGKKTRYDDTIKEYLARLHKQFKTTLLLLPQCDLQNEQARNIDSQNILAKIKPEDYVILLDEKGKEIDNDQLNKQLQIVNRSIVIVIGGSYGVNAALVKRANFIWSLGKLVYPYEVVRLILIEQIYRSQMIENGHPYHHR
ncbi:MAG: 23S rRNA (pseudouridine(1915)-N(3))-methyltransferase RlmH [Mycoplasmataceae bacterium]|nr:23S rRNA (pseudouridine(1915)-N(3))-methyltransferase RlmH [Mycoplasmataceae bacterium]